MEYLKLTIFAATIAYFTKKLASTENPTKWQLLSLLVIFIAFNIAWIIN